MADNKEIDLLNDSTLTFPAKTFNEAWDFNIPVFLFGAFPSGVIAAGISIFNIGNIETVYSDGGFMWSLLPFLNVLVMWPMLYRDGIESKLKDRGHKQQITFFTALKSWYRIPFFAKKKQLGKVYVYISPGGEHKLIGKIDGMDVSMGGATHEVTDYLVSDARGIRLERHVEPTPLYLWKDALKTIDEGFELRQLSS